MSELNPYQPSNVPIPPPLGAAAWESALAMTPEDVKKARNVIREADQFWLAILLMFLCSLGAIFLLVPWYWVRFAQWNGLAKKYPQLLASNAPLGSLPDKFLKAKLKLQIALGAGVIVLIGLVFLILTAVLVG
ncbi:MAG: hypothetical protein ACK5OB_09005 [Pirellula sp.]